MSSAFYEVNVERNGREKRRKNRYLFLVSIFLFVFSLFACIPVGAEPQRGVKIDPKCTRCEGGEQGRMMFIENFEKEADSYSGFLSGCSNAPDWQFPIISKPGQYTVTANAHNSNGQWTSSGDHTSGSGQFLICDAYSNKTTTIFCKTVPVTRGRQYIFCAWFKNLIRPPKNYTDPTVEMRINGAPIGNSLTLTENEQWTLLSRSWVSTGPTANLEIVITSKAYVGCDLGMDDISFVECRPKPDCKCRGLNYGVITYITPRGPVKQKVKCGSNLSLRHVCVCKAINLKYQYACVGKNCKTITKWEIKGPNNFHMGPAAGNGTVSFIPTEPGLYTITLNVVCGREKCPPCIINVKVGGIVQCNRRFPPIKERVRIKRK